MDDAGNIVQQVDCSVAPEQTTEPSLAGEVPNGGGPPPVAGAAISPILIMLLGGSLLGSGATAFTLAWLPSRRPRPQETESCQALPVTWAKRSPRLQRATPDDARSLLRLAYGFVIVATSAAVTLLLLSRAGGPRRH